MNNPNRISVQIAAVAMMLGLCCGCVLSAPPRSVRRPIHQYAENGDVSAVSAVLATNPAALNLPDDAGLTPLDLAASHCRTNVVMLLLDRGADVNRKARGGATPLHLAAQEGCVVAMKLLIAHGARVNIRDDEGRTPLKRAESWDQKAAAQYLREHGGKE